MIFDENSQFSRVFKGFTIGKTTSVSFRDQQVIPLMPFLKVKRTSEFYFFKEKCGQDRQHVKSDLYIIYMLHIYDAYNMHNELQMKTDKIILIVAFS